MTFELIRQSDTATYTRTQFQKVTAKFKQNEIESVDKFRSLSIRKKNQIDAKLEQDFLLFIAITFEMTEL
jgi:hypothetical protein